MLREILGVDAKFHTDTAAEPRSSAALYPGSGISILNFRLQSHRHQGFCKPEVRAKGPFHYAATDHCRLAFA